MSRGKQFCICGAPWYNKNQGFFYSSVLPFLVHWFMVSKSQDDCFRSRHCNHVQDKKKKKVQGVVPAASDLFWSLLSGNKRLFPKPFSAEFHLCFRVVGPNAVRMLPLAPEEIRTVTSFSILYCRSRKGWRHLEVGWVSRARLLP